MQQVCRHNDDNTRRIDESTIETIGNHCLHLEYLIEYTYAGDGSLISPFALGLTSSISYSYLRTLIL